MNVGFENPGPSPRLALAALCLLPWIPGASAQERVGTRVPPQPSYEDCRLIDQEHHRVINALHRDMHQCMLQKPLFGPGYDGCSPVRTVAWSQCNPIELKLCEARRRKDADRETCLERARRSARERDEERRAREASLGTKAYDQFRSAYELLRDPASFFRKALAPGAPALRDLLGGRDGNEITSLGRDVYGLAYRQARGGMGAVPSSGIVRAIQRSALDEINHLFKGTLDQLDRAAMDIKAFEASLRGAPKPAPGPSPSPGRRATGADPECAILDDPGASRSIMSSNAEKWLSLLARCPSSAR